MPRLAHAVPSPVLQAEKTASYRFKMGFLWYSDQVPPSSRHSKCFPGSLTSVFCSGGISSAFDFVHLRV